MKTAWAIPLVLRVALAAAPAFSVSNDLLAFPQYEVVFTDSLISPSDAENRLASVDSLHAADPIKHYEDEAAAAERQDQIALAGDAPTGAPSDALKDNPFSEQTYERLVLGNRPYLCTIPTVKETDSLPKNATAAAEEDALDLRRASDHGVELLQGMQGNCLYYVAGWWTYSFCYNDGVKQYHRLPGVPLFPPVEDKGQQSFMLGVFVDGPADAAHGAGGAGAGVGIGVDEQHDRQVQRPETSVAKAQLQTRGETNYLVQKLEGGTRCDLTGLNRRIEVQFHCNPTGQERIALIKETASCVYLMVIHTPRLCNDVAFMPPQVDKPNAIRCQQIVPDADVPAWTAIRAVQAERGIFFRGTEKHMLQQQQSQQRASSGGADFVGDIRVGGQVLIGATPETRVEPGRIVGGTNGDAPRKIVLRLAWTDNKRMWIVDEKEIEAAGIKSDMATVHKSIAQMKAQAKNTPWRLDIVDTEEGREIQGIWGRDVADEAPEHLNQGPTAAVAAAAQTATQAAAAAAATGHHQATHQQTAPASGHDGNGDGAIPPAAANDGHAPPDSDEGYEGSEEEYQ